MRWLLKGKILDIALGYLLGTTATIRFVRPDEPNAVAKTLSASSLAIVASGQIPIATDLTFYRSYQRTAAATKTHQSTVRLLTLACPTSLSCLWSGQVCLRECHCGCDMRWSIDDGHQRTGPCLRPADVQTLLWRSAAGASWPPRQQLGWVVAGAGMCASWSVRSTLAKAIKTATISHLAAQYFLHPLSFLYIANQALCKEEALLRLISAGTTRHKVY